MKYNRTVLSLIFTAWLVFFLISPTACSRAEEQMNESERRQKIETMYAEYKKEFPDVQDISPRRAMELADNQKVIFIDVREPDEQQVSMLANAVTDKDYLRDPEKYKDFVIIGYCTISYRSGLFVKQLQEKGVHAINLQGGILAWTHDGGKVYSQNKETDRIHVYGAKWNLAPDKYKTVW